MPHTTRLMTFAVKHRKEVRADEWRRTLVQRRAECIESLDREAMHFESIFKSERDGRMYLSWLSVRGAGGAHAQTSPLDIDAVHLAFDSECIDREVAPQSFEHIVDFVPASVEASSSRSTSGPRRLLFGRQKKTPRASQRSMLESRLRCTNARRR